MEVNGPAVVARLLPYVRRQVIPAYEAVGDLAFAYAQGSLVAGYTAQADLDLVLVWQGDPPEGVARPVAVLNDGERLHEMYDQPGFVLDRFWVDGQEFSAKHETVAELGRWITAVRAGAGWQDRAYPSPLVAVSGFCYGIVVYDPAGKAASLRSHLESFPEELVIRSRDTAAAQMPGYLDELRACAERADGLLFHELLCTAMWILLVAWFSAHGVYTPHEKWLARAIERHGLDVQVAELERRLWTHGRGLEDRITAFEALVAYVRRESGWVERSDSFEGRIAPP